MESNFLISVNYPFNAIHIAAMSTYLVVLSYIYMGVSGNIGNIGGIFIKKGGEGGR